MRIFLLLIFGLLAADSPSINLIEQGPECLSEPMNSADYRKEEISFESGDALLKGHLYLPKKSGRYPAMVLMHGGGRNVELLRSTPAFFAELLVRCGFAVITYDKHGLGDSGGDYGTSTFDTFVADAGQAGKLLSRHEEVDDSRIGILGFSQGGRLAPVAAVRYPHFAFAASVSGPIATVKETRLYAIEASYREAGVPDTTLKKVMPFWDQHLDALAEADEEKLESVRTASQEIDDGYNGGLLPPRPRDIAESAIFNSLGKDYTKELNALSVPWFSIFGEVDRVVPVSVSINNINVIKSASGNDQIEYRTIPNVGHSFMSADRSSSHRFEFDVLAWLFDQANIDIHPTGAHSENGRR